MIASIFRPAFAAVLLCLAAQAHATVIGAPENPGSSPAEFGVPAEPLPATPTSNYAFVPLPAVGFPLRVTPDGTAILGTYNAGNVYAYRWRRGVLTELTCERPPGTRIKLHAANRNGMVVVVFELPSRAFFAYEGGVTSQVVVAWLPESTTPVFLNVPIARATTWFNQSVMRSVEFKQLDDQNRIWGDTYHEVDTGDGNLVYPELARWDRPDAAPGFIGHKQHDSPSVILLGVSSVNGEPFGYYSPPEPEAGTYPFAGSLGNRLGYIPARMNSQGWVLGKRGLLPVLSRDGVEYPIPAVSTISFLDDRNNLYDASRSTIWTTNPQTFDSTPTAAQNSYVPDSTRPIVLAAGYGTNQRVIPGGTDIEIGTVSGADLTAPALFVPADLRPDADRDGAITVSRDPSDPDRRMAGLNLPWFYWVNDDDDSGETDGSDVPGRGANGQDAAINGVRDLIDFFPVRLNLARLLQVLPPDLPGVTYQLAQADDAANFVPTDLDPLTAGDYHRNSEQAKAVVTTPVRPITAAGTPLEPGFLQRISPSEKGVILVEARRPTTRPLQLEVRRGTDLLARVDLPLSFAPVETMFRHRNLAPACNVQAAADAPNRAGAPNWPDVLNNNQALVFVHGYNVNQRQARGWHAEVFKRLWWAGSNAQFWGVTWYGAESQINLRNLRFTPNYQANVVHAFGSAPFLAEFLQELRNTGIARINVAAHSLGNMVVSSAISDYAAPVDRYFMLDAAVAAEAYDGALDSPVSTGDGGAAMPHTQWDHDLGGVYPARLWAANWHALFVPPDARASLTWRDRFPLRTGTEYFNFYSSGEEVLDFTEASTPSVPGIILLLGITKLSEFLHIDLPGNTGQPAGHRLWQLQEQLKGRNLTDKFGGSNYGGWGFNTLTFDRNSAPGGRGPELVPAIVRPDQLSDEIMNTVFTPEALREEPFFRPGSHRKRVGSWIRQASTGLNEWQQDRLGLLYGATTGSEFARKHRNTLLARMIPALSPAAGRISMPALKPTTNNSEHNFDMDGQKIRPRAAGQDPAWPEGRTSINWRHSDLREVAYPYVRLLYEQIGLVARTGEAIP